MNDPDFIGYIDKPDVHDGFVLQVQDNGGTARILVRAYDGQLYAFEFDGVKSITSLKPEGMMLYSLSEMAAPQPFRRFVFVNWEDDSENALEVMAQQMRVRDIANETAF